jgi:hypothetical protein
VHSQLRRRGQNINREAKEAVDFDPRVNFLSLKKLYDAPSMRNRLVLHVSVRYIAHQTVIQS